MTPKTLEWRDGSLRIIDQTRLPEDLHYLTLDTVSSVWEAIQALRIRGAPAIGVCAAFGVVVAVKEARPETVSAAQAAARSAIDYLATSRPTAVNLFWALDRMGRHAHSHGELEAVDAYIAALEAEAQAILAEDLSLSHAIGAHGAPLIKPGMNVLTHCNAGGLATSGYGTALAVMFHAHEQGTRFRVYADETRPLLQGARLTAWELVEAGIDVTVLCDSAAGHLMQQGVIQLVIVGADRIARNGDAANKIGTYGLSVLAKAHGIPFYVAAPYSTFDPEIASGAEIPIEERGSEEIAAGFGCRTVPRGAQVYNPAFDVTPSENISGIISERGILRPPFSELAQPPLSSLENR